MKNTDRIARSFSLLALAVALTASLPVCAADDKPAHSVTNPSTAAKASAAASGSNASSVAGQAGKAGETPLTFAGWLIDRSCAARLKREDFEKHKDPVEALKKHSRSCSLEPECSEAGYTLYSNGQWYDLDVKGSQNARKLLTASKRQDNLLYKVTGSFKRNELRVATIQEVQQK